MNFRIPFHIPDVGAEEVNAAKSAVLDYALSGNGVVGRKLEKYVKKYTGAKYALFTTSCTSAVEMALMALEIGKGDEVVLPSFSFVSVVNAVVKTGAKPVFIDIDEETLNVNVELIKRAITPRTKAIIPVHYAGHSCPMDKIVSIAKKFDIKIIEDAAQAMGSFYKGRHLGTIGDIGCISFHGTKNLTCGEGGFFLTGNKRIAQKADVIREKGTNRSLFLKGKIAKYSWMSIGSSYVQSDILAAIAIEQLKKIKWVNKHRKQNAKYLNTHLEKLNKVIKLPVVIKGAESNWHIYAVRLRSRKERDSFINLLGKNSIECRSHFVPLHTSFFARKHLGCKKGDFPITERVCDCLARVPLYPQLTRRDLHYMSEVIEKIISYVQK